MNYFDAKNFCKSLDIRSHLVEIRSQEIQTFVETLDLSSNGHWWIGATDQQEVKPLANYYKVSYFHFYFLKAFNVENDAL